MLHLPTAGRLRRPGEEDSRSLEGPAQGERDPLADADRADLHLDATRATTLLGAAHRHGLKKRPLIDAHGAWCLGHAYRDRAVALAGSAVAALQSGGAELGSVAVVVVAVDDVVVVVGRRVLVVVLLEVVELVIDGRVVVLVDVLVVLLVDVVVVDGRVVVVLVVVDV